MSRLLIVPPLPFTVIASRGTGASNTVTRDPKEVWLDGGVGGDVILSVDLGAPIPIDTVALIAIGQATAETSWFVHGGVANGSEIEVMPLSSLRVPDVVGANERSACALHSGTTRILRYLLIVLKQPSGAPLSVGRIVVGRAFVATLGQEWGQGRRVVDTGTATPLPSGGFSTVDGVRKRLFAWTFGDLSIEEADRLEQIALDHGETVPALVIEDDTRSAGLRARMHYGLFKRWNAFDRRNRAQTRWEVGIEDWV